METNETILSREVVALNDRKKMGKLKGLRIDCDTLAVSHYVISSASTGSDLVLPFEKSLAVGDTFLTIQAANDVLSTVDATAKRTLESGFVLLNADVFSRTGNKLGAVKSFEFDPVYGKVTKIALGGENAFEADTFVFFSSDFVFVDDGEVAALEIRSNPDAEKTAPGTGTPAAAVEYSSEDRPWWKTGEGTVPVAKDDTPEEPVAAAEPVAAVAEPEPEPAPEPAASLTAEMEPVAAAEETPAPETTAAAASGDADDEFSAFLIGSVINDDVTSEDGAFMVTKGTVLTKEHVDAARDHNALLLLTMSVDI